jgi:hypothetical protein
VLPCAEQQQLSSDGMACVEAPEPAAEASGVPDEQLYVMGGQPMADADAVVAVDALTQHIATLAARGLALARQGRLADVIQRHRALVGADAAQALGIGSVSRGWAAEEADCLVVSAMAAEIRTASGAIGDEAERQAAVEAADQMEAAASSDSPQAVTAAALQDRMNTLLALGHTVVLAACAGGARVQAAASDDCQNGAAMLLVRCGPSLQIAAGMLHTHGPPTLDAVL